MKFVLFRPTSITVGMMVQLVALLSIFLSSVSAVPQFGRPEFHMLDEAESGNVLHHAPPSTTSAVEVVPAVSSAPVVNAVQTPAVTNDPVNDDVGSAASASASPSESSPPVQNQSSGASHQLSCTHIAFVLGTATSAAAYFVL